MASDPPRKEGLVKMHKKFGTARIWAVPIRMLYFKFDD